MVVGEQAVGPRGQFLRTRDYSTKVYLGDYFVRKHLRAFLQSRLAKYVTAGARVGDIGCGEQPFRRYVEGLGGEYFGIDVEQNANGTVHLLADIAHVPLPDGSFDVVLCSEVLEHVTDTYSAFRELGRLTHVGGHIIITTPFMYPLHEEPYDFVRLTPYQFRQCASAAALDVVELEPSGNEIEVLATLFEQMWWRIFQGKANVFQKALLVVVRLGVNVPTLLGSALFGRRLPRKAFLNLLCVLRRSGDKADGATVS